MENEAKAPKFAVIQSEQEAKLPKFALGQSKYDLTTFRGRLKHFMDVIDPRTLFTSDIELKNSIQLLDDFKNGRINPSEVTDEKLWEAQNTKQAIIHPDTGEKIFMPFRMSGFVPFGAPIVTGLLLPNPTLAQAVMWQWLNQSHNACVNYANRNASKESPISRFVLGYTGAVGTAVSIATGLTLLLRRADQWPATTRQLVQKFVPFPAVATASVCNVLLMRTHELSQGIDVLDSRGNVVATSRLAARKALKETAFTRFVLPAPILIIPPIVMTMLEKTGMFVRRPWLHLPINALTCTAAFGFALPVAIALFPQVSQIKVADLEEYVKKETDEEVLYFNKGL